MATAKEVLANLLEQEADSIKYSAQSLIKKAAMAEKAGPILQAVMDAGFDVEYLYLNEGLAFSHYSVKSFKAYSKFFEALEPLGYAIEGWTSHRAGTEMIYRHTEGPVFIRLSLYPSSELCERVQVGTKTEEVAVYELRCTEDQPVKEENTDVSSESSQEVVQDGVRPSGSAAASEI